MSLMVQVIGLPTFETEESGNFQKFGTISRSEYTDPVKEN